MGRKGTIKPTRAFAILSKARRERAATAAAPKVPQAAVTEMRLQKPTRTNTEIDKGSRGSSASKRAEYHKGNARTYFSDAADFDGRGQTKMANYAFKEAEGHLAAQKRAGVMKTAATKVKGAGMKAPRAGHRSDAAKYPLQSQGSFQAHPPRENKPNALAEKQRIAASVSEFEKLQAQRKASAPSAAGMTKEESIQRTQMEKSRKRPGGSGMPRKKPIAVVRGERAVSKERQVTLDTQKMNKQIGQSNPLFASQQRAAASKQNKERQAYVDRQSPASAPAAKKGKSYITVEGLGKDTKVTDHASKKEALAHGKALRAQGKSVFAHSSADAAKYGLDPRSSGQKRDAKAGLRVIQGGKSVSEMGSKSKSPRVRQDFTLDQMEHHSEQIKAGKKQASGTLKRLGEIGGPRKKPKDISYSSALPTAKLHSRKMLRAASIGQSGVAQDHRQQMHKEMRAAGIATKVPDAGKKHALQRGKRGGSFYISNGKKVYAKK